MNDRELVFFWDTALVFVEEVRHVRVRAVAEDCKVRARAVREP